MFYAGLDPKNMKKVFVERDVERKKEQKYVYLFRTIPVQHSGDTRSLFCE